jgi:hypothetical protein
MLRDKTARLWDIDSRSSVAVMRHPERVLSAAFGPDDKRVVTASSDGTARLWEVFADTQKLISAAKMAAPRCLTAEQREASFFLSAEPPAWCIEMAKWRIRRPLGRHGLPTNAPAKIRDCPRRDDSVTFSV